MKRWIPILLLCVAACGVDPAVAHKRSHLAKVVDELKARDVAHLTAAQREAREELVKGLQRYSERGRFPQNDEFPGREVPYFIDKEGTRCALAYLIDESGEGEIVKRLAKADNHAYVASLTSDHELGDWLSRHGLSIDEAAFIQAPGFVDDNPQLDWNDDAAPETPSDTPQDPSSPTDTPSTNTRRRATSSSNATWEQWWALNREAFVNLRKSYHERFVTTGKGRARPRRLSDAEKAEQLLPFLRKMTEADKHVRGTALMAWARAARPQDAAHVTLATLDYLKNDKNLHRDFLILALGIARDEAGFAPLREILRDTKQGRRALGRSRPVPERMRAFAAIALGRSGRPAAISDLIEMLKDKGIELRAAAVTALGMLAEDASPEDRARVTKVLRRALKAKRMPDPVLATIPTALAAYGDTETLHRFVDRFRGPREVRQSSALALGLAAKTIDMATVDALMALARRDADPVARHFAIISLGELCTHGAAPADKRVVNKLVRFYDGQLKEIFKQQGDRAWNYISAALFARRFSEHAKPVADLLVRAAEKGAKRDERAAAVIGLGLLGGQHGLETVRKLAKSAKDAKLRAYVAEAAGLLGDKSAKESLLALAKDSPSNDVKYRAAFASGMLADAGAVKQLVDAMASSKSRSAQAALTRVIGEIGDRAAVEALMKIAADEQRDPTTRQRALGALGVLGQDADRGWTYTVRRGFNFTIAPSALRTILLIF